MARLTGVLGILAILLFAYLFSTDRKAIRYRTVFVGLALQFVFAILVLRVSFGVRVMTIAGDAVNRLLSYSFAGSQFVFGEFGAKLSRFGVVFAFQVLPIIIFIAAFFSILYYYGVMQFIIRQLAKVMMRFMGASGVESLNVAASIFMGITEAPLTIRPFLPKVTRSELHDHHDQRHGPCFRRDAGRLYPARHRGATSVGRGDHDRAGNHPYRQDDGAGDRKAADRR